MWPSNFHWTFLWFRGSMQCYVQLVSKIFVFFFGVDINFMWFGGSHERVSNIDLNTLLYIWLNCIITLWGLCHLQTNLLGFQFCNITIWDFLIDEIDLSKTLSTFFVNFANKICHMHCTWVYNNEFFIIK